MFASLLGLLVSTRRYRLAALLFFVPIMAFAQISDVTPPTLLSLAFPGSVDVTQGPKTVPVTIHATDDLSGVSDACLYFQSLTAKQNRNFCIGRTSGTLLDAMLSGVFTMPQFSDSGVWTLQYLYLYDNAGNIGRLVTTDLAGKGFPTILTVASTPDSTPPTLTSLSTSPVSLDVSNAPQPVTLQLTVTDDVAGVDLACQYSCYYSLRLRSPSGLQYLDGVDYNFTQVSGTALSGVWKTQVPIPQYAEAGIWTIDYLFLHDKAGNGIRLDSPTLKGRGFPTSFVVSSSRSDITPPTLTGLTLPGLVDTSAASQMVRGTISVSDDLSGASFLNGSASNNFIFSRIGFASPSNGQSRYVDVYTGFTLNAGNPLQGTWSFQFTMPRYSEAGTWTVQYVEIEDAAHNVRYLNPSDLAKLPITTMFDVIQGSQAPDGTLSARTGGTVNDQTFGSRASITVPPGALKQDTSVSIDVLPSALNPQIPTPQGYTSGNPVFMNITLAPAPPEPFAAPGISITVPVLNMIPKAGTKMDLYRIDTLTGHLIPELGINGQGVSGVVAADGLSATFTGLASLSTVIGLVPSGIPIGDVNQDGVVDCADVAIVKASFGKRKTQTGYDPRADLNNDGLVDINDLALVLHHLAGGLVCR